MYIFRNMEERKKYLEKILNRVLFDNIPSFVLVSGVLNFFVFRKIVIS